MTNAPTEPTEPTYPVGHHRNPAPAPDAPAESSGDGQTFDADYVKKLRDEAAKYRTEARTNAEAAKKLADLEDAQKSETQKLTDAKTAAEAEAATARADALRWKIAAKHGITDEDAETFLTGTDEDSLTRQAERLATLAKTDGNTPGPRPDLSQGARSGEPQSGDPAQAFATFIKGQLKT